MVNGPKSPSNQEGEEYFNQGRKEAGASNDSDDQNFIKKDDEGKSSSFKEEKDDNGQSAEIKSPTEGDFNKKNDILPEGNRRRDLDVEKGGLESELNVKDRDGDAWDERSEEVDAMGSIDPIGSSAKKSMIWRLKRKKRREEKMQEQIEVNHEAIENDKSSKFRDKINQQRSNSHGNGGRSI